MSEYLIQGETLTSIADAIRAKTGGTEVIAASGFAEAIAAIQSGGASDVKMGTFTLTEGVQTYTVAHNLGKMPSFAICLLMPNLGEDESSAVVGSQIIMYAYEIDFAMEGYGDYRWGGAYKKEDGSFSFNTVTPQMWTISQTTTKLNGCMGCFGGTDQMISFGNNATNSSYGLYTPGTYFWIVGSHAPIESE